MPTAMSDDANPCMPRPISTVTKVPPIAASSEPLTITDIDTIIMRFFPPCRPGARRSGSLPPHSAA